MRLFSGTSGYSYKQWKGRFYPNDLPEAKMLAFYAERFNTVEINNTFYRMPAVNVIERWVEQVPDTFSFAIKAPRRITHQHRLKDVTDSIEFLFQRTRVLGGKRGPILFQLPPYLRLDIPRLTDFLAILPESSPVAMEFRHLSWFDDRVYHVLRERDVALCVADGELEEKAPFVATATWGYLRLRAVAYDDQAIAAWADRISRQTWAHAYVFFKHEDNATGPKLARRFIEFAGS